MLNAVLYVGISKLQARLESGKSAAILYALNEGLFKEGVITKEDYELLAKRYGRRLIDVVAEAQAQREPSHVPVLAIEKQKEQRELENKDKQFKGMIEQWKDHLELNWRIKAVADAEKWKDKLQSARDLLELGKKTETAT